MPTSFEPEASATVLVVGDVILDRYVHGDTTRISPEAPVPVVRVNATQEKPGGAANVALNVRALGVGVCLLGMTGADESAAALRAMLVEAEVQCLFVQQADFPTTTKLRVLSGHQQLLRLDYEGGTADTHIDNDSLYALYRQAAKDAALVVLSDYGKGSLKNIDKFIEFARAHGTAVLVDPKGTDFERYRHASLLTPNLKEFESVVGPCRDEAELAAKGGDLCQALQLDALLVTRGEQGMSLIRAGATGADAAIHLPAQTREVFDVTGAGDTVIAALAAGLASGYDMPQAMAYANRAAGLVVEKLGTATVSVAELNAAGRAVQPAAARVLGAKECIEQAALLRSAGRKLVLTNGCFDILHAGHVEYLQEARALGDCLIVAVNDDASVRRLKGQGRPVHSLHQRLRVLAGLAAVDWLVAFSEGTPEALIRKIRPHVLVKGGDYQPSEVAGGEFVKQNGGEVLILPYRAGCSTTSILQSIQNQEGERKA